MATEIPPLPPGPQDKHNFAFHVVVRRDLTAKEEAQLKKIADEHFESHLKAVQKLLPDGKVFYKGIAHETKTT